MTRTDRIISHVEKSRHAADAAWSALDATPRPLTDLARRGHDRAMARLDTWLRLLSRENGYGPERSWP